MYTHIKIIFCILFIIPNTNEKCTKYKKQVFKLLILIGHLGMGCHRLSLF